MDHTVSMAALRIILGKYLFVITFHICKTWQPTGRRRWPKTTWRRSVQKEAERVGMKWEDLASAAQDRARWKNFKDLASDLLVRPSHP